MTPRASQLVTPPNPRTSWNLSPAASKIRLEMAQKGILRLKMHFAFPPFHAKAEPPPTPALPAGLELPTTHPPAQALWLSQSQGCFQQVLWGKPQALFMHKSFIKKKIKKFCGQNYMENPSFHFQSHLNAFNAFSSFIFSFNSSCLHRVSVSMARWKEKEQYNFNTLKSESFRNSFCHLYSQPVAMRSWEYIKKRSKSHSNKTKPALQ